MHLHSIREPGSVRAWAHLDLPVNPLCWALGHRPRVTAMPSSYVQPGEPPGWVRTDCPVCGRRYSGQHGLQRDLLFGLQRETWAARDRGELEPRWSAAELRERQDQAARSMAIARYEGAVERADVMARGVDRRVGWHGRTLDLSCEAYWQPKQWRKVGARVHVGTAGSESPWHLSADLGPAAVYLSAGGLGGRLAEWLTGGQGRDLDVHADPTGLRWDLLTSSGPGKFDVDRQRWHGWRRLPWDPPGDRSPRYRSWLSRQGSVSLDWRDHLLGRLDSEVTVQTELDALWTPAEPLADDDGPYLLRWKLQRWDRRRARGRTVETSWFADWTCREGIPDQNHAWKGDCSYGSSVPVPQQAVLDGTWLTEAGAGLAADVARQRERNGFRWESRAQHQGAGT